MTRKSKSALSLAWTKIVPVATPARRAMACVVVASYPAVENSSHAAARMRSRVSIVRAFRPSPAGTEGGVAGRARAATRRPGLGRARGRVTMPTGEYDYIR